MACSDCEAMFIELGTTEAEARTHQKERGCWDCGSKIPGHHTALCETSCHKCEKHDLPARPGTQYADMEEAVKFTIVVCVKSKATVRVDAFKGHLTDEQARERSEQESGPLPVGVTPIVRRLSVPDLT